MPRLILIRHGETDYNSQKRYCGFSDPSLNNRGRRQSARLAESLKGWRIDKVYASDLKRTVQTAEIIFKSSIIEKIADFREMNFGLFEGLRYEEIIKEHPKLYRDWINNPLKVKIPGGESLKDLNERVKQRLSFILSQHEGKTIAVVTHGGPIRIILCDTGKFTLATFWEIEQETGALNIIDYPKGLPPVVVKMNDVSHLSKTSYKAQDV